MPASFCRGKALKHEKEMSETISSDGGESSESTAQTILHFLIPSNIQNNTILQGQWYQNQDSFLTQILNSIQIFKDKCTERLRETVNTTGKAREEKGTEKEHNSLRAWLSYNGLNS